MNQLIIRKLINTDQSLFTEAIELLNRTQGRNLFDSNYLDIKTKDQNSIVLGAFNNNQLLGIGVAQVINDFKFYSPFDPQITNELQNTKVGSLTTLAILESHQGQGIGKKITVDRLNWLKEQGCKVIIGLSWVSGLKHTSDRIFEKMGFRAIKKIDQFFKESSIQKPFDCPGCLSKPCTCAGIMYRLDLRAEYNFTISKCQNLNSESKEVENLLAHVYVESGFTDPIIAEKIFAFPEVQKRGEILLARDLNRNLIGMIICALPTNPYRQVAESDEAEMHLLAVETEWRSHGLGKELCLAFENQAQQAGYHKVVLSTQVTMKAAHALYEKLGYQRSPSRDWNRNERQFLVYAKNLI
jgi:ribosomal protein S18 acetylase RimI-like enzyme